MMDIQANIEAQEKEVQRLSPIVEQLSKRNMEYAELEVENQKLTQQLSHLKQATEEKLKHYPTHAKNISLMLRSFFVIAIEKTYPKKGFKDYAFVVPTGKMSGEYQCNAAMSLKKVLNDPSVSYKDIAEKIVGNFPDSLGLVSKLEVAGPGFICVYLGKKFIVDEIRSYMANGVRPRPQKKIRILVDFSSPNVAKEMHVGHLRSTIIGETIARLFEYQGHDVLRINHIGDWGTQFGMLIAHLQDSHNLKDLKNVKMEVQELQDGYKQSKKRFDDDAEFKKRAYQAVVALQKKEKDYIDAWNMICDCSRQEFEKIYERLGVTIHERGESFYQDRMDSVVELLQNKNLLIEEDGRKLMFPVKIKAIPLTVVKSDGAYTYDTSDLAAIKYRIEEDKADRILYVTDAGQAPHFHILFDCAEQAGILDRSKVRAEHVGFGVVLGEDKKKFKTRSGDTVRLKELLDEGLRRARDKLVEKGRDQEMTEEELDTAQLSLAYGCIRYSDLAHNRMNEYLFSFDKMLDDRGNTAVYLLYAYTRIKSIARKAEVTREQLQEYAASDSFEIENEKELKLCKKLLKFPDVIDRIADDLNVHQLCELMYEIAAAFTEFYDSCYCISINKTTGERKINMSRLVLCEVAAIVLKQCFDLLAISPVSKM